MQRRVAIAHVPVHREPRYPLVIGVERRCDLFVRRSQRRASLWMPELSEAEVIQLVAAVGVAGETFEVERSRDRLAVIQQSGGEAGPLAQRADLGLEPRVIHRLDETLVLLFGPRLGLGDEALPLDRLDFLRVGRA